MKSWHRESRGRLKRQPEKNELLTLARGGEQPSAHQLIFYGIGGAISIGNLLDAQAILRMAWIDHASLVVDLHPGSGS